MHSTSFGNQYISKATVDDHFGDVNNKEILLIPNRIKIN